jgi:hypothetical protein
MFPEFRAWHEMLPALFGVEAPEWKEKQAPQGLFAPEGAETDEDADEGGDEESSEGSQE